MPLKLSLKPNETLVLNGAVVRNGSRRTTILLENQARVLREKDMIDPAEAESPASQAYVAIMEMYLTGELNVDRTRSLALALAAISRAPGGDRLARECAEAVEARDFYKALSALRPTVRSERTAAPEPAAEGWPATA